MLKTVVTFYSFGFTPGAWNTGAVRLAVIVETKAVITEEKSSRDTWERETERKKRRDSTRGKEIRKIKNKALSRPILT